MTPTALLSQPLTIPWKHRDLLRSLVRRNIAMRHRGSLLGAGWLLATPLLMLAVYTVIFSQVFQVRWGTENESSIYFALALLCGLTVYNIVSETLSASATIIAQNPNYVTKVVFPLEILPVSTLLTSLTLSLIWFGLLLAGVLFTTQSLPLTALLLPVVLAPLVLMTCGLSWLLASLGVYFRDVSQALVIVLQVLFFLTPIFYNVDMIPDRLRTFIFLNPLTGVVENTRSIILEGELPDWRSVVALGVASVVVFFGGFAWFRATKQGFADVL